ncbi:MAG: hypothetical protein ACR2QI_07545 [Woeseiaceae bacterium]
MRYQKNVVMVALATLGLFFSAGARADFDFPEPAPQSKVDMCVAEISEYADYSDATRVRHDVESTEWRTVGYILKIDTLVYGAVEGEVIREYATKCLVASGEKPVKFTIKEISVRA